MILCNAEQSKQSGRCVRSLCGIAAVSAFQNTLYNFTTVAFVCLWGGITAPQTHESNSSDRPKLEDTTNPTTHGDWRLYVRN
jgi:hypothetical protein